MRVALAVSFMLWATAACSVARTTFTPIGGEGDAGGGDDDGGGGPNAAPGQVRWARSMSVMSAYRARLGATGLTVAGSFNAPATLGATTYTPFGGADMAFAHLDPATGAVIDAATDGNTGYEAAFVDTIAADGAPILHGITSEQCDIGTGPMPGGGGSDTFIGRYDHGAVPSWSYRLHTAEEDKIIATAPGPNNTVLATGYFVGSATIGSRVLTGGGGRDAMLLSFDATTGALGLAVAYGSSLRDEGSSVVAVADGTVLGGVFEGAIQLGQRRLTSAGGIDAFVGKLVASDVFGWATAIGGTGTEAGPLIGADAAGDIYATGTYQGTLVLDAAHTLTSVGADDVYVLKLSGDDGHVVWARSIGAPGTDNVLGLAVAPDGRIAVAGNAAGALDIGGGNQGKLDAFLASFETDGTPRWQHVYGSAEDDRGWSVSYGNNGMLYATLSLGGAVELGARIDGAPNPVGVVLELAP